MSKSKLMLNVWYVSDYYYWGEFLNKGNKEIRYQNESDQRRVKQKQELIDFLHNKQVLSLSWKVLHVEEHNKYLSMDVSPKSWEDYYRIINKIKYENSSSKESKFSFLSKFFENGDLIIIDTFFLEDIHGD